MQQRPRCAALQAAHRVPPLEQIET